MKVFVALIPKTYKRVNKKAKGTNKCCIKQEVKFEDYKKCQESNKTIIRLQQMFRCELCNVLTKKFTKIDLSENDDKRFQKLDGVTSYHMLQVIYAKQNMRHPKINK